MDMESNSAIWNRAAKNFYIAALHVQIQKLREIIRLSDNDLLRLASIRDQSILSFYNVLRSNGSDLAKNPKFDPLISFH